MAALKVRKKLFKKSFTQYTNTLNEMKKTFLVLRQGLTLNGCFTFI